MMIKAMMNAKILLLLINDTDYNDDGEEERLRKENWGRLRVGERGEEEEDILKEEDIDWGRD